MNPSGAKRFNAQIYDEASEWFIEFRAGDIEPATRRRFNAWLRTSPEHVRAYLELAAIWNEGSHLDPSHQFDGSELTDEPESNVVPIPVPPSLTAGVSELSAEPTQRSEKIPALSARWYFAFAASLVFALLGTWGYLQRGLYSTDIGEQRSITLVDGSRVELNARSQLRVHFTDHTREIELLEGQALFQVAKDTARPFIVRSANTQVRAVGTQFDVYRRPTGTTVTVVEGRVAVLPSPEASRPNTQPDKSSSGLGPQGSVLLLTAGEQVTVSAIATAATIESPIPRLANITAATAWTQNRLIFESATLVEVADEFNRYNERRLVIESPELHDFHITGTFSSSDPAALLRFLESRPGIIVTEGKNEIRISR